MKAVLAISVGASLGALLRWTLGIKLNGLLPSIPPGTFAANIIGGFIVGLAIVYFADRPEIAPEWRLLAVTGFCGGLTTFSTFSAEVVALIQQGDQTRAGVAIVLHVASSLAMTLVGIGSMQWIAGR